MKKKVNIALLIGVAGLWCTVIYRYMSHFFYAPVPTISRSDHRQTIDALKLTKDTFQLEEVARDPFLNKVFIQTLIHEKTVVKSKSSPKTNKKITIENVPVIRYFGYLKKQDNLQKELVLLEINGALQKIRVGNQIDGVKVLGVSRDSVKLLFNKNVLYIKR